MTEGAEISIVLVDDQPLVREGLRAILQRDGDITVIGEGADGREGVAAAARWRPDVVLMDLRMPGLGGLDATRRITADPQLASVRVLVLTTFDTDDDLFGALDAGAAGFVLKDGEPDELRRAVRTVAAGGKLLSPSVTGRVVAAALGATRRVNLTRLAGLTEREREVLTQVGRGRSNDEIAAVLHISRATARTYVSRLLAKLQARDRAQLVVIAYQTGLAGRADP
jgi:DNA-binding NarL/FixJ family response regulator